MEREASIHHRRSIRVRGYDYAAGGTYFVTVCSHERETLFGRVVDDAVVLHVFGSIVEECWLLVAERHPWVRLDASVVMPNHFHGVIAIEGSEGTAVPAERVALGRLIAEFKSNSTRTINLMRSTSGAPVWQRNYYEHIIRNERALEEIRRYIHANPANWRRDPYNT